MRKPEDDHSLAIELARFQWKPGHKRIVLRNYVQLLGKHWADSPRVRNRLSQSKDLDEYVISAVLKIRELTIADVDTLVKLGARNRVIIRPPGWRVREIFLFVFSKRTNELVFDQTLADMQHEWTESIAAGRIWHARWVQVRGYVALAMTCVAHVVGKFGLRIRDIWRLG